MGSIAIPRRRRRRRFRPKGPEWITLLCFVILVMFAVKNWVESDSVRACAYTFGSVMGWLDVPGRPSTMTRGARSILQRWLVGEPE